MTIRKLPEITAGKLPETFAFEPDADALDRWNAGIRAEQTSENTITMLDVIGEDWWTGGGVTANDVQAPPLSDFLTFSTPVLVFLLPIDVSKARYQK